MNLNLGAGYNILEGWINQDIRTFKGIDEVWDFNIYPWHLKSNYFDKIRIINCIHCVENLVRFMEEIWRISKHKSRIYILTQYFLSPESGNDPYTKLNINFNTFNIFLPSDNNYYSTKYKFKILKRKWVFSDNKYLKWLSFFPNIFPRFYGRFLYFYFPSNKIYFELEVIKDETSKSM